MHSKELAEAFLPLGKALVILAGGRCLAQFLADHEFGVDQLQSRFGVESHFGKRSQELFRAADFSRAEPATKLGAGMAQAEFYRIVPRDLVFH
jgi:hypothetical protein